MYELLIGMMAERLPEELLVQRGPHPRKFDWERLQALAGGAVAQVGRRVCACVVECIEVSRSANIAWCCCVESGGMVHELLIGMMA